MTSTLRAVRGPLSLWVCALFVTLLLAPGAWAQGGSDDPMVDPESPAGTEYELPIDRAREEARGGSGGSSGSAGEAPLFGEGVDDKSSGSGAQQAAGGKPGLAGKPGSGGREGSDGRSGSNGAADTPATSSAEQTGLGTSAPEAVRAQAPAPDGGSGSVFAIGGIAAAVLLIGALAGVALRRRAH